MSINVTCPGCDYHFLVGEESAGKPGRCPECGHVIDVPGVESEQVAPPPERHPYESPHHVERFEDFPRQSRLRVEELDEYHDQRDDYDDRVPERTFDRQARAARWQSVSNGLRNLMVAVVLLAVRELIGTSFVVVDGVRPAQPDKLGARDQALIVASILTWMICLALWVWGRVGCARVPYVPARGLAMPAAVIAVMTGLSGMLGLGLLGAGILVMGQGNLQGLAIANLGSCAVLPAMFGFVVAETIGLASQIRMAVGLNDAPFRRSSRVLLISFILVTLLSCCAAVGFVAIIITQVAKAQQQQQFNARQQPAPADQKDAADDKDKGDPPDEAKQPAAEKKAAQPGNGGQLAQKPARKPAAGQPPAGADVEDHPEVLYAALIVGLVLALAYAVVVLFCFQLGRAAIRREIAHLIGDPHDRDHIHDPH